MSEQFDLDRDTNIKNNIDATGKKWIMVKDRTNHMLHARPEGGRADSVIPEELQGAWTKQMLLKEQIDLFVRKTWDKADEAKVRKERREQAQKEQELRNAKAEKDAEEGQVGAEGIKDEAPEPEGEEAGVQDVRTKEEEVTSSFEKMPYDQLLVLAKSQGITSRKKAEIIEALTNGTEND